MASKTMTVLHQSNGDLTAANEVAIEDLQFGDICIVPLHGGMFIEEAFAGYYHMTAVTSTGAPLKVCELPDVIKSSKLSECELSINDSIVILRHSLTEEKSYYIELTVTSISFEFGVMKTAYCEVQEHKYYHPTASLLPMHIAGAIEHMYQFKDRLIPLPFNRPDYVQASIELLVPKGDDFVFSRNGTQYAVPKISTVHSTARITAGLFVVDTRLQSHLVYGYLFDENLVTKTNVERHPAILLNLVELYRHSEFVWLGTSTGETILGRQLVNGGIQIGYYNLYGAIHFVTLNRHVDRSIIVSIKPVLTQTYKHVSELRHQRPAYTSLG